MFVFGNILSGILTYLDVIYKESLIADDSFKPRFYNLSPADYSNQDVPKNDGLVRVENYYRTILN